MGGVFSNYTQDKVFRLQHYTVDKEGVRIRDTVYDTGIFSSWLSVGVCTAWQAGESAEYLISWNRCICRMFCNMELCAQSYRHSRGKCVHICDSGNYSGRCRGDSRRTLNSGNNSGNSAYTDRSADFRIQQKPEIIRLLKFFFHFGNLHHDCTFDSLFEKFAAILINSSDIACSMVGICGTSA